MKMPILLLCCALIFACSKQPLTEKERIEFIEFAVKMSEGIVKKGTELHSRVMGIGEVSFVPPVAESVDCSNTPILGIRIGKRDLLRGHGCAGCTRKYKIKPVKWGCCRKVAPP